ncbi:MAG: sigma-70 family RNA polymerase sigma factor [Solobacterium sp.]|nr:sigma-70 family RNA polymerase sigma factor [Solobacterium sp.]
MKKTELEVRKMFHSFCVKSINNAAISMYRKMNTRDENEFYLEDLPPGVKESICATNDAPEEEREFDIGKYRYKESVVKEMLAEAIAMLPIEKHKMIIMYYFDEMIDREIAEVFGLSRSTIQSKRANALKLLIKHLERIAENYEHEDGND